ncbi:MAG TPA: carboxypeptidase regulatory-like domain-containing protein [Candidatus Saccharimonadales bacterium]
MSTPTKPRKNIKTSVIRGVLIFALCASVIGFTVRSAQAEVGNLSLSPSSGTYTVGDTVSLTITEDSSSEQVNSVEADLTYDPAVLQYQSIDGSGSAFTDLALVNFPSANAVNVSRGAFGATYTGPKQVAIVRFKVLAASGSTSVSFASSSQIVRHDDRHNVWNGAANPANFVTKAVIVTPPANPPAPAPSSGGSATGTSTKSSSGGSTASSSSKASSGTSSSTGSSSSTPNASTETTTPAVGNTQLLPENSYLVAIYVKDKDGKPVNNASVTLQGKTVKTAPNGLAGFIAVPIGSYDVKVSYNGQTQTQKITVSKPTAEHQSLQKFNIKLAASHNSSWLVYSIVLLVIIGLGAAGFVIPRKNKFHPPKGGTPLAATENMVVGDVSKPVAPDPDPTHVGQIIRPTNPTNNDANNGSKL